MQTKKCSLWIFSSRLHVRLWSMVNCSVLYRPMSPPRSAASFLRLSSSLSCWISGADIGGTVLVATLPTADAAASRNAACAELIAALGTGTGCRADATRLVCPASSTDARNALIPGILFIRFTAAAVVPDLLAKGTPPETGGANAASDALRMDASVPISSGWNRISSFELPFPVGAPSSLYAFLY